jgi:hypothetical protein
MEHQSVTETDADGIIVARDEEAQRHRLGAGHAAAAAR